MTIFIRPTNARQRGGRLRSSLLGFVALMVFVAITEKNIASVRNPLGPNNFSSSLSSSNANYNVDDNCKNLPTIRRSGGYFLDSNIKPGMSADGVSPAFKVGSYFHQKIKYHMAGDAPNFHLIKDFLKGKEGGLAFDMGANQGFYTYYLATLGMQVHSFEINEMNFKALQHGAEFNPKEVSDRTHFYPFGLGQKNARFGLKGANYEGFLKESNDGPILGITFDCFSYHMHRTLDISKVAFIKLDVEGFEIAVLKGTHNSLFKPGTKNVGAMIMEVGPDRWGRASIDLATGVDEMKKLSTHFKASHIVIRGDRKCPTSLTEGVISDKKPVSFDGVTMFRVKLDEWEPLLSKMEKNHNDCNFFYTN